MNWKIRFYSGLNKGVETELANGRFIIGSDPVQADLILVDAGIEAVHLILEIEEEGIRVIDWSCEETPQQNGQAISQGEMLLPYNRQDAGMLIWSYSTVKQQLPANPDELTDNHIKLINNQQQHRHKKRVIFIVIAIFSILFFSLYLLFLAGPAEIDYIQEQHKLQNYLNKEEYKYITMRIEQEKQLFILGGYVQNNQQRLLIKRYLDNNNLNHQLNIYSIEEIKQSVKYILHTMGYNHIEVNNSEKIGWIDLFGEVRFINNKSWSNLATILKRDVTGLKGINNHVKINDDHLKKLVELLEQYELINVLIYNEKENNIIELYGYLNEKQRQQFIELQQTFNIEFKQRYKLKLIKADNNIKKKEIRLDIKGISLGRSPYLILRNNMKYSINATLPTGETITAIEDNKIILKKNSQEIIITLKE